MRTVFFYTIVCTLLLGFVSCGDKNDDPAPSKGNTIEKMEYTYSFEQNAEALEVADITFTYLDETGKSNTEKVTGEKWSKTIVFKTFPAKVEFKAAHMIKENLTKEKYNITFVTTPKYTVYYSDGTTAKMALKEAKVQGEGVLKDKVGHYLTTTLSTIGTSLEITKTSDGEIVVK